MKRGWCWRPMDQQTGGRKELWQLLDVQGVVRAEVYKSANIDTEGKSYAWAVWPYHVTGNIGSDYTVIDARIHAEKRISNKK